MQPSDLVLVEAIDRVGIITMNRPQSRNAINTELSQGIARAIDRFEADDSVTVIILTGAGGTFSAGMDLKAFAAGERPAIPQRGLGGITEHSVRKPLIAAVEGYVLAGGLELALAADVIVASSDAQFGLPEVKRGLVAAGGGLLKIAKVMPFGAALAFATTGEMLSAERALNYGLVTRLAEPGQALDAAKKLAQEIASNAPISVTVTKEILSGVVGWFEREAYNQMRDIAMPVFDTEDAQEGALAFAEKRQAKWKGR